MRCVTPPRPADGALDGWLTPLAGGHSGETFLARTGDGPTVVRVYARSGERRGPDAAEVDAAVLHLVRGCSRSPRSSRSVAPTPRRASRGCW
jgi:hypothetical protein